MAKRRILVVGYPKSGNTWLTRLTAELLGAPVRGFWNARPGHDEIAIEGETRVAEVEVEVEVEVEYKGHQRCAVIRDELGFDNVIYVVRDVRDVAVSGAHYFSFRPRSLAKKVTECVQRVRGRSREQRRVPDMLRVLAHGDAGLRVLARLGAERSAAWIRGVIAAQSFAVAKRRFLERADFARATFLREGRSGAWRTTLTTEERALCVERFGATLARLGYETSEPHEAVTSYSS